jgi:hypothetical protein
MRRRSLYSHIPTGFVFTLKFAYGFALVESSFPFFNALFYLSFSLTTFSLLKTEKSTIFGEWDEVLPRQEFRKQS